MKFKVNSGCGSAGVCYEDWWAVPALPISAEPEPEQQQVMGSNQV